MIVQLHVCAFFSRIGSSQFRLRLVRVAIKSGAIPLNNMVNWLCALKGAVPSCCRLGMTMRSELPVQLRRRLGEWRSSLLDVTCQLGRMPPVCSHERAQPLSVSSIQALAGNPIAHLVRGS